MLIPDSTYHKTLIGVTAVVLPVLIYLKLTAIARYRRRDFGAALTRAAVIIAIVIPLAILGANFEDRGSNVWVYHESGGRPVAESYYLYGRDRLKTHDGKFLDVEETSRNLVEGNNRWVIGPSNYVLNDTSRPLTLKIGFMPEREERLESGLLFKTTDSFSGDVQFGSPH